MKTSSESLSSNSRRGQGASGEWMCPHRQGVHGQWRGKPGQSWGRRATGVRGRAVGPAGYSTAVGVAEGDGERYARAGSEDSSVCQEAFSPVILPDSGGPCPPRWARSSRQSGGQQFFHSKVAVPFPAPFSARRYSRPQPKAPMGPESDDGGSQGALDPVGLHTSILSWHGLPSYAGGEGPVLIFCGCQNK